jgi:hypothetical protein
VLEKKYLSATDIASQSLIVLPDRPLLAIIVPFPELISMISILFCSSLFLTGLLWKNNSSLVLTKHQMKEGGIQAHVRELASQATLSSETNQQPDHYPHENVVFHVTQLRAEALRRQRAKKRLEKPYQVVATLRQAGEKTGVPHDKIVTTRDIEAEYHINKKLVHEYTQRGREGRPHLTPLSVRLSGGRGGQLLFRREDIERLVANPPSSYKGGRPRK